jgi:hypothetical protein
LSKTFIPSSSRQLIDNWLEGIHYPKENATVSVVSVLK